MKFLLLVVAVALVTALILGIVRHPERRSLRARALFVFRHLGAEAGAVNAFIPEIWAAELLASLKKALVFSQPSVSNRNRVRSPVFSSSRSMFDALEDDVDVDDVDANADDAEEPPILEDVVLKPREAPEVFEPREAPGPGCDSDPESWTGYA